MLALNCETSCIVVVEAAFAREARASPISVPWALLLFPFTIGIADRLGNDRRIHVSQNLSGRKSTVVYSHLIDDAVEIVTAS